MIKLPAIPQPPKIKKPRSPIYAPSWKQIGKKKGSGLTIPKIKVTSDNF